MDVFLAVGDELVRRGPRGFFGFASGLCCLAVIAVVILVVIVVMRGGRRRQ